MNSIATHGHTLPPVLVLGATGQVGQALIPLLIEGGHAVLAVSRQVPVEHRANVIWIQQDLSSEPIRSQTQTLLSVGPLSLALRQVRATPAVRRVIALSSASVLFKHNSKDRNERAMIQTLLDSEQQLERLAEQRGIDLTLLRPTLIYGGDDANISVIRKLVKTRRWLPCAGNGLRQPAHVEDLADLIVCLIPRTGFGQECFELGGGEALGYRDMIQRIAQSEQQSVRLLRLPPWLITPGLRLAHMSGRFQSIRPAMIARQREDLDVDDTLARQQLNWQPRPFEP